MRLLVTGASGLIGSAVVQAATAAGHEVLGLTRTELDITRPQAVSIALRAFDPQAVLNAAAQAHVDLAEQQPDRTALVNGTAVGQLAWACRDRGVRLVHLSTDYVLDAPQAELLHEALPASPQSAYARTKRAGEEGALAAGATVVRVQWVYGPGRRGFFTTALRRLAAGLPVSLVTDQIGVPTGVHWLAEALVPALESGPAGLFHLAPRGEASAEQWILAAARHLGLDTRSATPATRADFPGAARPARSCLDPSRYARTYGLTIPHWDTVLAESLDRAPPAWLTQTCG